MIFVSKYNCKVITEELQVLKENLFEASGFGGVRCFVKKQKSRKCL